MNPQESGNRKHLHVWYAEPTGTLYFNRRDLRMVVKHRCKCGDYRFVDWFPRVVI